MVNEVIFQMMMFSFSLAIDQLGVNSSPNYFPLPECIIHILLAILDGSTENKARLKVLVNKTKVLNPRIFFLANLFA